MLIPVLADTIFYITVALRLGIYISKTGDILYIMKRNWLFEICIRNIQKIIKICAHDIFLFAVSALFRFFFWFPEKLFESCVSILCNFVDKPYFEKNSGSKCAIPDWDIKMLLEYFHVIFCTKNIALTRKVGGGGGRVDLEHHVFSKTDRHFINR